MFRSRRSRERIRILQARARLEAARADRSSDGPTYAPSLRGFHMIFSGLSDEIMPEASASRRRCRPADLE
jgi:hypothetical protein